MLGVTWSQIGHGGVTVDVRTSEDGTLFGRSTALSSDPDEGPDPGTPEFSPAQQGTSVEWTGGSRCAHVAMRLPADVSIYGVRVTFLNTSGTAAGPGTAPQVPESDLLAIQQAYASEQQPQIVTRQQWGANPKYLNCKPYYAPVLQMAFIHHTDNSNSYTRAEGPALVRGIYYFHTNVRHWCDIAYNFLIDKYGTIYEGRAGGMTLPVVGAGTMGFNFGSTNIALIGNYATGYPTRGELTSLKRLLAWRLDVGHVPPIGKTVMISGGGWGNPHPKGQHVKLRDISGHRDANWTDCPGSHVETLLPQIRRAVQHMGLPKIYLPHAARAAPGSLPWIFTARGSQVLDWTVTISDAGGTVVRRYEEAAALRLHVAWDGLDAGSAAVPPGKYTVSIAGSATSSGKAALPATLTVHVGAPPSPSPSPSPTGSPTP